MDFVVFLVKHLPFWAIPLIIISAEFGYLFWLKDNMHGFKCCIWIAAVNFILLITYYWLGGPVESARLIHKYLS